MKDIRDLMEDTQQMQNERTKLLSALLDSDLIQKYLKEIILGPTMLIHIVLYFTLLIYLKINYSILYIIIKI